MAAPDDFDPEYDPEPPQVILPSLLDAPTVHPACCLALSNPLLAHLASLLPPAPRLTLSIGSGYGLLEALFLAPPYSLNIIGVEVQPSSNTHLPHAQHREVAGSRFLEPLAAEAEAWMFVYPRRVGLVEEYIREFGTGNARAVVWVGPTADWEDYKGVFWGWDVEVRGADEVGGRAWEVIAVAMKKPVGNST
ncbi:hypothetical protein PMIN06_006677 [Paraphaeosphaeria minitans]|uniref:Uncharacterized protein n=1 Tax=Paraphaeosphaeria minitans TaxID=565426 RepID=A0A9P6GDC1_9PLEO|nr:hypothetical protein PMIN01_10219 [Paraphaeosphaeria minitans]